MLKVLYAGSPEQSATTLKGLIELSKNENSNFKIVGVLSNPPSAKKRSGKLTPTPVAAVAEENNIPVFTPEHLDLACREHISVLNAEILVCFAYGHIFGPKFLNLFKFGGINLHPSALPKYRGCTPVNSSILNRDKQTAFTIQKISIKMDEGEILAQKFIDLNFTETAESLLNQASVDGIELISEILEKTEKNQNLPEGKAQSGEASYTKIILKEDSKINWNDDSEKIDAFVRAYSKEPGAWTLVDEQKLAIYNGFSISEEELKNLNVDFSDSAENIESGTVVGFIKSKGIIVKCAKGFYSITELQKQGKNIMDYKVFMNGARDFVGKTLK